MIYATLQFPKYADGTRKVVDSIHPSFAAALEWGVRQLPKNGDESEFVHTLDDVIENALVQTREAQPVKVETFTIMKEGSWRYILTLEVR